MEWHEDILAWIASSFSWLYSFGSDLSEPRVWEMTACVSASREGERARAKALDDDIVRALRMRRCCNWLGKRIAITPLSVLWSGQSQRAREYSLAALSTFYRSHQWQNV